MEPTVLMSMASGLVNVLSRMIILTTLCVAALFAVNVTAMGHAKNSEKVMAAFLMHFTGYTTWPDTNLSEINVCLLGEVSFDGFIKSMVKAKPNNRRGQKLNIHYLDNTNQLANCQVAFISQSKITQAIDYRDSNQLPILLVSNSQGFIDKGGMVNFITENKRVRFQVGLDKLKAADIKMSAELLRLAVIKKPKSEPVAP